MTKSAIHKPLKRHYMSRASARELAAAFDVEFLRVANELASRAGDRPRLIGNEIAKLEKGCFLRADPVSTQGWQTRLGQTRRGLLPAEKNRGELAQLDMSGLNQNDPVKFLTDRLNKGENAVSQIRDDSVGKLQSDRQRDARELLADVGVLRAIVDPALSCGVANALAECNVLIAELQTGLPVDITARWEQLKLNVTRASPLWPEALNGDDALDGRSTMALVERVGHAAGLLSESASEIFDARTLRVAAAGGALGAILSILIALGVLTGNALTIALTVAVTLVPMKWSKRRVLAAAVALTITFSCGAIAAGSRRVISGQSSTPSSTPTTEASAPTTAPTTSTTNPTPTSTSTTTAPTSTTVLSIRGLCGSDRVSELIPAAADVKFAASTKVVEQVWLKRGAQVLGCPQAVETVLGLYKVYWFVLPEGVRGTNDPLSAVLIYDAAPFTPRIVWQGYANRLKELMAIGEPPIVVDRREETKYGHFQIFRSYRDGCSLLLKVDGSADVVALLPQVSAFALAVANQEGAIIIGLTESTPLPPSVTRKVFEILLEKPSAERIRVRIYLGSDGKVSTPAFVAPTQTEVDFKCNEADIVRYGRLATESRDR